MIISETFWEVRFVDFIQSFLLTKIIFRPDKIDNDYKNGNLYGTLFKLQISKRF